MKNPIQILLWLLLTALVLIPAVLQAQTNVIDNPSPILELTNAPLPVPDSGDVDAQPNESASEHFNAILLVLVAAVAPILVRLFKMFAHKIPTWSLPIIAPALVALTNLISDLTGGPSIHFALAALLGSAGVGIREIIDQIKQKMNPPIFKKAESRK